MHSVSAFDGLLAAMPASVLGGTALGWWLAIPTVAGAAAGGMVAAVFIVISLLLVA